jgi:tetratricopeptide (TPR) repeat protein
MLPEDWARLEDTLFGLTLAEITAFAERHPVERCYGFAFDCDADHGDARPCLNTEESLSASVRRARDGPQGRQAWKGASDADIEAALRWNPGDWAYQPIGDDAAWSAAWEPLREQVEASGLAEDDETEGATGARFLEAVTRVLLRLEGAGAFASLVRTDSFSTLVIDHEERPDDAWARIGWLRLLLGERGTEPSAADRQQADELAREALVCFEGERHERALELTARALATDGGSPRAHVALGALALAREQTRPAQGAFTLALAAPQRLTETERAEAHAGRGMARLHDQDPRDLLADFEAALALDPGHDVALYGRGVALLRMGRPHDALASLDACLGVDPGWALARLFRSSAHAAVGSAAKARADRKRALAEDPELEEIEKALDPTFGRRRRRRP